MKILIKTDSDIITAEYENQILLSDILEEHNLKIQKPCGGSGKCGKCKVIASGGLSALTKTEADILTEYEILNNVRLACLTYAVDDAYINYTSFDKDIQGITKGFMPKFEISPITKNKNCYGVAIDIGTTTIAAYLYKFPESICVKSICKLNNQVEFGADVISRIEYAKTGLQKLQSVIKEQIKEITDEFNCDIDTYVITGNTTMLHLLTGLDPSTIAHAPFTPKSLFGEWYEEKTYIPPCISSYVGADITTAILASDMIKDKKSFLVDIGTNGEMALWDGENLVCCSTAAGPAFEGAGISQGMAALDGAINKVYIQGNTLGYTTIGDKKPIGICGSGLVDAISCMLYLGIIDETGYMDEDYQIGDSDVFIRIEDVRQVQLAKSAIRSGIDTLVHECNIGYDDIEVFYIAGGFGSYLDKKSCAKIGLIPNELIDKVRVIGNAAGSGASMILQSKQSLCECEKIADTARTIELSDSTFFMDKYIDNMMF